jgi:hypothetical protein
MSDPSVSTGNDQLAFTAQAGGGKGTVYEGGPILTRCTTYGEPMTVSVYGSRTPDLAREGSRWVVTNVPGTAIVDPNASGFVTTTPCFLLANTNPVGGRWIYPVRLKMTVTAAGTSSTNFDTQWYVDTGNRYTSGGTALTPVNPNLNVLNTLTGAVVHFGAITATAANAQRLIHACRERTVIKVIGDEYTWEFGHTTAASIGMPTDGTLQLTKTELVTPVALPPQSSLLFYEYGASQGTAAQFDMIVFEYDER